MAARWVFFLHDGRVTGSAMGDLTAYFVSGWAHPRPRRTPSSWRSTSTAKSKARSRPGSIAPDVRERRGIAGRGFFFPFPTRLRAGDLVEIRDEFDTTLPDCTRTYEVPELGATTEFYGARAPPSPRPFFTARGVEVGAFHMPTDLPPDREIVFYDRFPTESAPHLLRGGLLDAL